MLREYERGEAAGASQVKRVPKPLEPAKAGAALWGDRAALRKCVSVDDSLLQQTPTEPGTLLSCLERGKKKVRNIHVSWSDLSQVCLCVFYSKRLKCFFIKEVNEK